MNKYSKGLLGVGLVLCLIAATWDTAQAQVHVTGDVAVSRMVEKHVELNSRVKTIPGYRVQIASFSGVNSKNSAFELRDKFNVDYPEVQVYIVFDEPNFKVKVGDFRTRLEAYLFLQRIRADYPGTIIRDNIYPMQIDWTEMVPESEDDI